MRSAPWKKRFAAVLLTVTILLVALCASQHRLRLIAGSYKKIDSSAQLIAGDSLRFLTHAPLSQARSFSEAISTLRAFDSTHPLLPEDALPTLDQPDTSLRLLEAGHRIHCYNVDIAVAAILAKENIPARLWDLNGSSQLGGDGHNLLGIYDGVSHSWKAVDPYYHCYFILGSDSTPVDIPRLRLALLTQPSAVHLVTYSIQERPDSDIIAELKFLAPGAMLHANNDFAWRYDHRYGWLTPIAASLFDGLPLRYARGIRTIMLGAKDPLLVIEDRFSPHFPFALMKLVFWTLVFLFVFSLVGLVIASREDRNLARKSGNFPSNEFPTNKPKVRIETRYSRSE